MRDELTKHLRGEIEQALRGPGCRPRSWTHRWTTSSAPWAEAWRRIPPRWPSGRWPACPCPSTSPPIPATCWPRPWRRRASSRWWSCAGGTTTWSRSRRSSTPTASPTIAPPPERPLVYHLFGRLSEPDSLVITEDDYFDYLIGVTSRNDLIPGVVRRGAGRLGAALPGLRPGRVGLPCALPHHDAAGKAAGAAASTRTSPRRSTPKSGRIIEPEGARRYLESTSGSRPPGSASSGAAWPTSAASWRSACRKGDPTMTNPRPNPYPGPRSFQRGREALRPRSGRPPSCSTC